MDIIVNEMFKQSALKSIAENSYYNFNHNTNGLVESIAKKSGREGASGALFIAHYQARVY